VTCIFVVVVGTEILVDIVAVFDIVVDGRFTIRKFVLVFFADADVPSRGIAYCGVVNVCVTLVVGALIVIGARGWEMFVGIAKDFKKETPPARLRLILHLVKNVVLSNTIVVPTNCFILGIHFDGMQSLLTLLSFPGACQNTQIGMAWRPCRVCGVCDTSLVYRK